MAHLKSSFEIFLIVILLLSKILNGDPSRFPLETGGNKWNISHTLPEEK